MAQTQDLMKTVSNNAQYEHAVRKAHSANFGWIIENDDLVKIALVRDILYLEQRLNADTQRDLAHILSTIFEYAIPYDSQD